MTLSASPFERCDRNHVAAPAHLPLMGKQARSGEALKECRNIEGKVKHFFAAEDFGTNNAARHAELNRSVHEDHIAAVHTPTPPRSPIRRQGSWPENLTSIKSPVPSFDSTFRQTAGLPMCALTSPARTTLPPESPGFGGIFPSSQITISREV